MNANEADARDGRSAENTVRVTIPLSHPRPNNTYLLPQISTLLTITIDLAQRLGDAELTDALINLKGWLIRRAM